LLLIFACLATCTVSENSFLIDVIWAVPTDLNEMTKDLVKTSDLENIVTGIVKKLFSKFESSLEKKMNEKIIKIQSFVVTSLKLILISSRSF
jgi:hypothetical protein